MGAQLQGILNSAYEITDANGYIRTIGVSMKWLYTGAIFLMLIGALIDSAIAVSTATYEEKMRVNNDSLALFSQIAVDRKSVV